MATIKSVGDILKKTKEKLLTLGTPPEEEVLYEKVKKRKIPSKRAERLTLDKGIDSMKKVFQNTKEILYRKMPKKDTSSENTEKLTLKKGIDSMKETFERTKTKVLHVVNEKTAALKKETKAKDTKKTAPKKTKTAASKKTSTVKKPAVKKTATKKTEATTPKQTKTATTKKTTTVKKPAVKKTATKKTEATTPKQTKTATTKKTTTVKKPAVKKTATKKTEATTPKGTKKASKIALYTKDIKKYYGEVDEDFLAIIVKNLGPSIYRKDAELVSCSDPKELDTVRKNFLQKKLGIDASQAILDAAIQDVCEELKSTRTKYRATFYYSLAKKFKKESVLS